ncbi:hypothetical protein D16iCDA_09125 [Pseudomonas seleniipraecipitans]|jgi:hypothetical protein|uniref:Uncharacterized protein n=2 Tax=Phytopseudomonas seleniipraecipitans TaxID=640205 RepID=A0A1G7SIZ9_9GAMM|nr:hypothetical protein [Pseudomonas seleniipraecipitans]NQD81442.1 hypothetical protein [Pseudomonas sp. CrR14]UUD65792.1 hypothetical protein D16iCDA_09125 [Pseudomonas seleniipraecipitans]SDG22973.1 hypothetical protein SAMN05216381_3471 [Pseudomonas seleniipraecipitans]
MTVSAAVATAAPTAAGQDVAQVSQNLFEHMASQAKGMPQGASPNQIGENLMERLNGFIDRSRGFSEGAAVERTPYVSSSPVDKGAGVEPGKVNEQQIDRLVGSLSRVFDYSIETQMVVRGATQISGSANTLLRGQ